MELNEFLQNPFNPQQDKEAVELEETIRAMEESRQTYSQKCYINDAFMDGEHFVGYNRTTGRLEKEKTMGGAPVRVIHKGRRKLIQLVDIITSDELRWVAKPTPNENGEFDEQSLQNAQNTNDFLSDVFNRLDVEIKVRAGVYDATKSPYSFYWASYNEVEDTFEIENLEFYDVLCDAHVTQYNINDSSILARLFMQEESKLKANPEYTIKGQLQIDRRWSSNEWKNIRMEEQYFHVPTYRKPVSCAEVYKRIYMDEKLRNKLRESYAWVDEVEDGQAILYRCVLAGGQIIHKKYFPYSRYPGVPYKIDSGKLLSPAPVERIIPANKSLDSQISRQEQYVSEVAVGRVKKHKTAKIYRMNNKHGSFWEWEGAPEYEPKIEPIPSLPATVMQVQQNTERFIDEETVYGSQAANVVAGGRGAEALESLRSTDVQSAATPRKNFAYAMQELAEIILMLADYHLDHEYVVTKESGENEYNSFSVIGSRFANTEAFAEAYPEDYQGVRPTVLSSSQKVTVQLESGMAHTARAKQDLLMQLASMGAISTKTLLTHLKAVGNVSQELRQMQVEQSKSMLETDDFKVLPPQIQETIIRILQEMQVTMPMDATKSIGSVKRGDVQSSQM